MATDPNNPNLIPEMIPPSDIEGLTAQIGGSAPKVAVPEKKAGSPPLVFRRLSAFSATELRKLRERQEEFVRSLAARLSGHLRLEVGLKITDLESLPFGKLVEQV